MAEKRGWYEFWPGGAEFWIFLDTQGRDAYDYNQPDIALKLQESDENGVPYCFVAEMRITTPGIPDLIDIDIVTNLLRAIQNGVEGISDVIAILNEFFDEGLPVEKRGIDGLG